MTTMDEETLHESFDDVTAVVRTRELTKRYGKKDALAGLDLAVPEGSVYVLVGPNGAGKTTTMGVLMDLVRPTAGTARVFDRNVSDDGAYIRGRIGYVPESVGLGFPKLTVGRLLEFHSGYFPSWDDDYAKKLVTVLDVDRNAVGETLSKGQSRRVQLVMALAHRPSLLLLDEPTDGLDPLVRDRVLGLIAEHMAETPTTLFISTHHVHEVEGLADHLGVVGRGRLTAQLRRHSLDQNLRNYRASVPEDWTGGGDIADRALREVRRGRECSWTIWGDQHEVTESLHAAGATVNDVATLNLEEASRTLLEWGAGR